MNGENLMASGRKRLITGTGQYDGTGTGNFKFRIVIPRDSCVISELTMVSTEGSGGDVNMVTRFNIGTQELAATDIPLQAEKRFKFKSITLSAGTCWIIE